MTNKINSISSRSTAFMDNQFQIIHASNEIFLGTKPLDGEALEILETSFKKSLRKKPTLEGRL